MALPLPPGLTPNEVGFLCEMELVTVVPRQRLDSLELLGGPTQPLRPPFPASLPLWLALLLKRQKRANIVPPPWMSADALAQILDFETDDRTAAVLSPPPPLPPPTAGSAAAAPNDVYLAPQSLELSPPFLRDASTARAPDSALPYHWLELAHLLVSQAPDDFDDADAVRRLIRDLREVRMSKLRKGFKVLNATAGVKINGVGAMEVAEVRGFIGGMVDGLRRINRSREEAGRERDAEDRENGFGRGDDQYDDDDMQL